MLAAFPSAALTLALLAQDPNAEQLRVEGPSPPVVRLGEACRVTIEVSGESAQPRPPRVPEVAGLRVQVAGPSREERMFFDGRTTRRSVSVSYQLVIQPLREGEFEIPSFAMFTGTREQRVRALRLRSVRDVRGADHGYFEVAVSSTRVYVNEPVTIEFDYGVDARLQIAQRSNHFDVEVLAPWLDEMTGAVTVESGVEYDGKRLPLILNNRSLEAAQTTTTRGDQSYYRFRFARSFMPTRPGSLRLDGPVLRFGAATGAPRRDFFGSVVGRAAEDYFIYGEPIVVEVQPIPEEGRPISYTGAVGRLALSADVDRRRVKVGDSIKLRLRIQGRGNTEFFDAPDLGELDGFHLFGSNENRGPAEVVVTYDLAPLTIDVAAVPSIEWSYFDTTPGTEAFVTVRTDPIPLEVLPLPEGEALAPLAGADDGAVVAGVDDIFDIQPLAGAPPIGVTAPPARWSTVLALLVPWLLGAAVHLLVRRRRARAADVVGQRARLAARSFERALAGGDDPVAALAAYVGDRIGVPAAAIIGPDLAERLAAAGFDPALGAELREAIDEGIAARYGGGSGLSAERARDLVRRAERCAVRPAPVAVALLVLALAGALRGQDTAAARAEAAYRAGDYAAAAAAYRVVAESGDCRARYNLGNALYRDGRLTEALVEYERARLAMPRDEQVLRNIELVEKKLALGSAEGEPFFDALTDLRAWFTPAELWWGAFACHCLAAFVLWGGRRGWRWLMVIPSVPAVLLTLEVVWWGPTRPARAIVLPPHAAVSAEPREGLEPVVKLRGGVAVELLGRGPQWSRVRIDGRSGYLPSEQLGVVE